MIKTKAVRRNKKAIASLLIILFMTDIMRPTAVFALTGGPSQPEVQSFEPFGTSEMVDLFSGNFTYNIPLLEVGTYPVNLSYSSGVGVEQEASMVGLGWNINAGTINRSMRGIPDDYLPEYDVLGNNIGDKVTKEFSYKPNRTYGAKVNFSPELIGFDFGKLSASFGVGINYNNYKGIGFETSVNASLSLGKKNGNTKGSFGIGMTANDQGLNINPSLSFSVKVNETDKNQDDVKTSIGASYNSRAGLKSISISSSVSRSAKEEDDKPKEAVNTDEQDNTSKDINGVSESETAITEDKTKPGQFTGSNGGANISFSTATFIPNSEMNTINQSYTFSVKLGSSIFGGDATANISGYFSESRLKQKSRISPAYGYFYTEQAQYNTKAIRDFNRENDGLVTDNTTNLALTNYSYDIFSVSGQGIGGNYRAHRSDIGFMYDPYTKGLDGANGSIGIELGATNLAKAGADIDVNITKGSSGAWLARNELHDKLKADGASGFNDYYEPFYLKQIGEKTPITDNYLDDLGNTELAYPILQNAGGLEVKMINTVGINNFPNESLKTINNTIKRSTKKTRNQPISYLTMEETVDKKLGVIKPGSQYFADTYGELNTLLNTKKYAKKHHIGQITTLTTDGARYIYGFPLYNSNQEEVSFSVSDQPVVSEGLVTYVSGTDDSKENKMGIDNFYSKKKLTPYSHSFLLSAVLSADYIDRTNNGPSNDDYGTYTVFKYGKSVDAVEDYKWRMPFEGGKANFSEALKSNEYDNKASYVYGVKNLKYLKEIITKNYKAVFDYEDRTDAIGVKGSSGGHDASSKKMRRLNTIKLYSLPTSGSTITKLVKTVHFTYSYELCPGIPNSSTGQGKLTLKSVYFTYEGSNRGRLNAYKFKYAHETNGNSGNNVAYNPDYGLKHLDRWGNYQPNNCSNLNANSGCLANAEFPYTRQADNLEINQANINVQAWNMTEIQLPSGGKIAVDYETDDYAFVQDRPAMRMFKIIGAGSSSTYNAGIDLYSNGGTANQYIYFKLPEPNLNSTEIQKRFNYKRIVNEDDGLIYFRFLVDLTKDMKNENYDYVPGYATITDMGFAGGTNNDMGYIKLELVTKDKPFPKQSKTSNPISKAAWQFARLQNPRKAYDLPDPKGSSPKDILKALGQANMAKKILELIQGPNGTLKAKKYGRTFVSGKSWIRLYEPKRLINGVTHKGKIGGGSRVKKIGIHDRWGDMINGSNSRNYSYEQVYNYDLEDGITSSGVASYEPAIGGDENVFRKPVYLDDNKSMLLAPGKDINYIEEPLGESFFPSASVGYSRITVKNIARANVSTNATGKVVSEFYTAKDFPTITKQSVLDKKLKEVNPLQKMFNINVKSFMNAAQGYLIELNDMHGKPKAIYTYAESDNNSAITSVEYFYKTKDDRGKTVLNNSVSVVDENGNIETREIATDVDVVADFRESQTRSTNVSLGANMNGFLATVLSIVIPTVWPGFGRSHTRLRTGVITKVVNRFGVLEKTVAKNFGSKVVTENLLYDKHTGEVILNSFNNQFNDKVYAFNYPAHWMYEGMGMAYKNWGRQIDLSSISNGKFNNTTTGVDLTPGAHLVDLGNNKHYWVSDDWNTTDASLFLVDVNGLPINSSSGKFKVLNSGRKNLQNQSIGTFKSMTNPMSYMVSGTNPMHGFTIKDVLDIEATAYSDEWNMFCGGIDNNPGTGSVTTSNCSTFVAQTSAIKSFFNELIKNGDFANGIVTTLDASNINNNFNYASYTSSTGLRQYIAGGIPNAWVGESTHGKFEAGSVLASDKMKTLHSVENVICGELAGASNLSGFISKINSRGEAASITQVNSHNTWSKKISISGSDVRILKVILNPTYILALGEIVGTKSPFIIVLDSKDGTIKTSEKINIHSSSAYKFSKIVGVEMMPNSDKFTIFGNVMDKSNPLEVDPFILEFDYYSTAMILNFSNDILRYDLPNATSGVASMDEIVDFKYYKFNRSCGGTTWGRNGTILFNTDIESSNSVGFVDVNLTTSPKLQLATHIKTELNSSIIPLILNTANTQHLTCGSQYSSPAGNLLKSFNFFGSITEASMQYLTEFELSPNGLALSNQKLLSSGIEVKVEQRLSPFPFLAGQKFNSSKSKWENFVAKNETGNNFNNLYGAKIIDYSESIVGTYGYNGGREYIYNSYSSYFNGTQTGSYPSSEGVIGSLPVNASGGQDFFFLNGGVNLNGSPTACSATPVSFSNLKKPIIFKINNYSSAIESTEQIVTPSGFSPTLTDLELELKQSCCIETTTMNGKLFSLDFSGECSFTFKSSIPICFSNIMSIAGSLTLPSNDPTHFRFVVNYFEPSTNSLSTRTIDGWSCLDLKKCDISISGPISPCEAKENMIVNPYLYGLKGIWKPKATFKYLTDRSYNSVAGSRKDGIYDATPYWKISTKTVNTNGASWTFAAEATKQTPNGTSVESIDALGRYSAELVGYRNEAVVASAVNASYNDIGFDGFEDYDFIFKVGSCIPNAYTHFNFYNDDYNTNFSRSNEEAHTGMYSLIVSPNGFVPSMKRPIKSSFSHSPRTRVPYLVKNSDCLGVFSPNSTSKGANTYVLSYWVKEKRISNVGYTDYANTYIDVKVNGVSVIGNSTFASNITLLNSTSSGQLIDGWLKKEIVFKIPRGTAGEIDILLVSTEIDAIETFFDDIRIQPVNSTMKTYVYDPLFKRLMAEHDENNYATFYEYDQEGSLLRIKKETERGIYTIQETRKHSSYINP